MHKDWDDIIRQKSNKFESPPPSDMWDRIRKDLEPDRKRAFPIWWTIPAAAAVILLGIFVSRLLNTPDTKRMEITNVNPQEKLSAGNDNSSDAKAAPEIPVPVTAPGKVQAEILRHPVQVSPRHLPSQRTPVEETLTVAQPKSQAPEIKTEIQQDEKAIIVQAPYPEDIQVPKAREERVIAEPNPTLTNPETPVAGIVNAATELLGIDAHIEERRTAESRSVAWEADLGFISFKRVRTYRNHN